MRSRISKANLSHSPPVYFSSMETKSFCPSLQVLKENPRVAVEVEVEVVPLNFVQQALPVVFDVVEVVV